MSVYEKLLSIQKELKAPKNAYNSFGKYNYRSCEDILEGLKPVLEAHKATLFITDSLELIGERYYIKATVKLIDIEDGSFIENSAYARESFEKKGMDDSQVTGATSSYARKYALNGLFLIDDTKDADTDEYQNQQSNKQANKQAYKQVNQQATSSARRPQTESKEDAQKNQQMRDSVNKDMIPKAETLISAEQIKMMQSELKRTGVSLAQILSMAQVDSIEKMNQSTACALLNKLGKTSSVEEKNNG